MFEGKLLDIFITAKGSAEMDAVESAEAVTDKGLAGDRYEAGVGTFSRPEPDRQITLIESEAIEALPGEYKLTLQPSQSRRNLLTQGVPLNHLVGQQFRVGDVLLRGIRLCEPCKHLEKLTVEGVEAALRHRGGLRAQIVEGGTLRRGDTIRPA